MPFAWIKCVYPVQAALFVPFFAIRNKKTTVRMVKRAELPKNIAIRKAHIAKALRRC